MLDDRIVIVVAGTNFDLGIGFLLSADLGIGVRADVLGYCSHPALTLCTPYVPQFLALSLARSVQVHTNLFGTGMKSHFGPPTILEHAAYFDQL